MSTTNPDGAKPDPTLRREYPGDFERDRAIDKANADGLKPWHCAVCGKGWDGKGRAPCSHDRWCIGTVPKREEPNV